jgi:hypothetical protein
MQMNVDTSDRLVASALGFDAYECPNIPSVPAMITPDEQRFLACAAERMWDKGANLDGLIIDAGCYAGASTVSLSAGLQRSRLPQSARRERIWSYDRFLTTPVMAQCHLSEYGTQAGDSFRPIFERNIEPFRDSIRVFEGDIRDAAVPDGPIALLFVDLLWGCDVSLFMQNHYYSRLEPGRSLLVHQDFVYPHYPWLILSMGLLEDEFEFGAHVQFSSVVFDVKRTCRSGAPCDARDISLDRALGIYDRFIERVDGWAKGALALGKALYLASRSELTLSARLVEAVEDRFGEEPLVTQYISSIRDYAQDAAARGAPLELDTLSGQ